MATQQIINIGTLPNDGQGDPLRVAFQKTNNNFTNLFSTATSTSNAYSVGNTAGQVIYSTPANTFTSGSFIIRSSDPGTNSSQNVNISAQKSSDNNSVKFVVFATTFYGAPLTQYDMGIVGGNILIKVDPLTNENLLHFISAQILYIGDDVPGIPLQLDGYVPGSIMSTENDLQVTTQD